MALKYFMHPIIKGMSKTRLLKERAKAKKMATVTFPKNLKDPEFRAATKIMKYKKRQYYG